MAHRIHVEAQPLYPRQFPPILQHMRKGGSFAPQRVRGIGFCKSGLDGCNIAAMAVDPIEAVKARAREACRPVDDGRDHG